MLEDFPHKQYDISDVHSVRTTTNSDSRSLHTAIFTAPRSLTSTHSEACSTPSHSRAQSVVRCGHRSDMDMDLVGIGGYQIDPDIEEHRSITLPNRPLPDQSSSNRSTVDGESVDNTMETLESPTVSSLDQQDTYVTRRGSQVHAHDEQSTRGSAALEAVGDMFSDLPSPCVYTIGSTASSSGSFEDGELHLEKLAGDLLSEWYGINIDTLERPIRVIHALEQVKDQVAEIIEDEGYSLLGYNDEPTCSEGEGAEDKGNDRHDTGETSRSSPQNSSSLGEPSGQNGNTRKRSNSGDPESKVPAELALKTRDPKRRRRLGFNFSCPYRKQNPRRFNVSDYERCALRFYANMATLKRHSQSDHYKPVQNRRVCSRCQKPFKHPEEVWNHLSQCRSSPQPQPPENIRDVDPEDGFGEDVKNRLLSRKEDVKIDEWAPLYMLLFPGTRCIPEPDFEPVVEDHEIVARIIDSKTSFYTSIEQLASQHTTSPASCGLLRDQIQQLVEERDSKLLDRHSHSLTESQTPMNYRQSQASSVIQSEDDFVHIASGRTEMGDDNGFFSTYVGGSPRDTPLSRRIRNGGVAGVLGGLRSEFAQVIDPRPSFLETQTELLPAISEQGSHYRSTRPPFHPAILAPSSQGATTHMMGMDIGLPNYPTLTERSYG
ncbi:hypothetical protein SCUP234_07687 [Seiridium cupressi]